MLNRDQKNEIIKGLKDQIQKASALFVTDLIGITANDAVIVRKKVRDAGGHLVITKNKLFAEAAKGTSADAVLGKLKGTNAVAFSFKDAPAVAKVINDTNKDLEKVTLKSGILDGKALSAADCKVLANLPSRDQMLGTLLATFNAPASAFVRVLEAIKTQKEEGTATVA